MRNTTLLQKEEGIRYNARDLAVALGGFSKCPVVLGSATPSSESYANARRGRYRLMRLMRASTIARWRRSKSSICGAKLPSARKLAAAKSTNGRDRRNEV